MWPTDKMFVFIQESLPVSAGDSHLQEELQTLKDKLASCLVHFFANVTKVMFILCMVQVIVT